MVILEDLGCGQNDEDALTIMGKSILLKNLGLSVDSTPCDDLLNGIVFPSPLEESHPHAKTHDEPTFSENENLPSPSRNARIDIVKIAPSPMPSVLSQGGTKVGIIFQSREKFVLYKNGNRKIEFRNLKN